MCVSSRCSLRRRCSSIILVIGSPFLGRVFEIQCRYVSVCVCLCCLSFTISSRCVSLFRPILSLRIRLRTLTFQMWPRSNTRFSRHTHTHTRHGCLQFTNGTASGSLRFRLLNLRSDYVFYFLRNAVAEPIVAASSTPVVFRNPNEPTQAHIAFGAFEGGFMRCADRERRRVIGVCLQSDLAFEDCSGANGVCVCVCLCVLCVCLGGLTVCV